MTFFFDAMKIFVILFVSQCFGLNFIQAESPKICLTMIVKNEEKIIERCLTQVKDIVDLISICDTGSTDRTVEIIEKFMAQHHIPGKVHHHTWKNFGHNRTLSAKVAQKTIQEFEFSIGETYLLFLDADMMLEISNDFKKEELRPADQYLVMQQSTDHAYYNTRLVRAVLPWECIGVTHEYWSSPIPSRQLRLTSLKINDCDDGGCKSDKFERDIRMLTEGLKEEPDNARYLFYLAQSYKCLRNFEEAIKWYEARINKKDWFEEVWYSQLMIGECYEELGKWDKALEAYLEAYQYNPDRAEPLHHISQYYRLKEKYHLAYTFAKEASKIPYPHHQILFVSHPIYDYLIDQDLSISSYFTPFKEEGYAASNRLLLNKHVPTSMKDRAFKNLLFYLPNLPNMQFYPIQVDPPLINKDLSTRYQPLNPSISKTAEGYDVICRTVNYKQIGAQHFKSLDWSDETNLIKTKNLFVKYDRQFNKLSQSEIVEELPRRKFSHFIQGLEDCRMVNFNDEVWFTCTTLDTNPRNLPQISLCKLGKKDALKEGKKVHQVEKLFPLPGPDPSRCEKNWLPFAMGQHLHFIYSYDPLIIYRADLTPETSAISQLEISHFIEQEYDFTGFSGSAAPIPFDEGYLLLVHQTIFENQRIYTHRFVYVDEDFRILRLSKPFTFLHKGVEYCCGMATDHSNDHLVMAIGIEDCEAYLGVINLETVRSLLEPLPQKKYQGLQTKTLRCEVPPKVQHHTSPSRIVGIPGEKFKIKSDHSASKLDEKPLHLVKGGEHWMDKIFLYHPNYCKGYQTKTLSVTNLSHIDFHCAQQRQEKDKELDQFKCLRKKSEESHLTSKES